MNIGYDPEIKERKIEHIKIVLDEDVAYHKSTWFEYVHLIHNAIPEINSDEIDLTTEFLGRKFSYPILIDSMTGGVKGTEEINRELGMLAFKYNIPISCGSQKSALKDPSIIYTYRVIREISNKIFLIGNIGAHDLVSNPVQTAQRVVEMIEADALAIHLNPLQEVVQTGRASYKGVVNAIRKVVENIDVPVIIKETGAGISMGVAKILESIGVSAINISGAGGTSWSAVESIRNLRRGNVELADLGKTFREWGIPTAAALIEVVNSVNLPIISSGGIRSGLDVVKSLVIGATFTGIAAPFIKALMKGGFKGLEQYLKKIIMEVKTGLFLIGVPSINFLRRNKIPYVVLGPLKEWLISRGIYNEI